MLRLSLIDKELHNTGRSLTVAAAHLGQVTAPVSVLGVSGCVVTGGIFSGASAC